ncbi:hypothetical protein ACWCPQ_29500 [Nocardia sp. NPDC001965]
MGSVDYRPSQIHPSGQWQVRPLMYGYLRLDLLKDAEVSEWSFRMNKFAEKQGYEFGTVFHEESPQTWAVPEAFVELAHECRRTEAHVVATPYGHLSGMAMPKMCLLNFLAARGHAHLAELPVLSGQLWRQWAFASISIPELGAGIEVADRAAP